MKQLTIIFISIICLQNIVAQNASVKFIDLPDAFKSELEISGMVGNNNILYLVSEREKILFTLNIDDYSIIESIDLTKPIIDYNSKNPDNEINLRAVEMEGLTWYNNQLLFVDEGNTAIYKYDLNNGTICKLKTNLDLSEFTGGHGMEGIAVNSDKKLVYILRERNGNKQSEIYTLHIDEDFFLNYNNEKYIIDHENNNWRYCDIFYDKNENTIYGLRSYYDRNDPELAECYVDKIPLNEQGFLSNPVQYNKDKTLSDSVIKNRCKYASNLEGLYKTDNKFLIVSDNQRSTKKCDIKPTQTMFIEYFYK